MKRLIIFLFLIFSGIIFSQNYNDAFRIGQSELDFDARTLSMGNSTIGALGNFSSTLINPAGLATIRRDVFSLSFNSNGFNNSISFLGNSTDVDRRNGNINQVSLVMPLPVKRGSAVLAFGYNQSRDFNSILEFGSLNNSNTSMIQDLTNFNDDIAYELGVSYPVFDNNDNYLYDDTQINGNLYQSGKVVETGSLNNWIMSGAAEVAKNLFVGATLNIISGDYKSNRTYLEDDYDNDYYSGLLDPADSSTLGFESFYINDIVDWEITGWDIRLGLLYKMNSFINFGASVKLPSRYKIKERYSIYGESEFQQNYFLVDYPASPLEYEIITPMEFSGGVSAVFPLFTVNAGLKFIDYSQLEFDDGFSEEELFEMNNEIQELLTTTVNWNIGAEFTLPYPSLKIRGGFMYYPSAYKNDSSEFDKKYVTGGIGFPIAKRLLFDFAYVYGWWKDFGDNYGVDVSRTYQDIKVDKMVFSISYVFM